MNLEELGVFMDTHMTGSAFRLEARQTYEVASDGTDYRRYLDGEPHWTPERKQPWLDHLAAERAAGRYRHRVRIVERPVTPYTRYECEWGYVPNVAAGEDVRILDLGEHQLPDVGLHLDRDWWLLTDAEGVARVVVMNYDENNQFVDAVALTDPRLVSGFEVVRDLLWSAAEPFTDWWSRHGELHREGRRAA
jgi:hypothetical protein